jgi:hypothetical protein
MDAVAPLHERLGTRLSRTWGAPDLTQTTVAAGGLVPAGAGLRAIAGNGDDPEGPLLFPTAQRAAGTGHRVRSAFRNRKGASCPPASSRPVARARGRRRDRRDAGVRTADGPLDRLRRHRGRRPRADAATALAPGRGRLQRTLDGIAAALAAWTIVENLVFSRTLMAWLTFGAAAGIVAIGVAGLIAHELSTERVVHSLEDVRSADRHMEALA